MWQGKTQKSTAAMFLTFATRLRERAAWNRINTLLPRIIRCLPELAETYVDDEPDPLSMRFDRSLGHAKVIGVRKSIGVSEASLELSSGRMGSVDFE
jgi:hypothetical protein